MTGILAFDGYEADLSEESFLRRYPGSINIPSIGFPFDATSKGRLGGNALRHDAPVSPPLQLFTLEEVASSDFIFGIGIELGDINAPFDFVTVVNGVGNNTFRLSMFVLGTGYGIQAERYDSLGVPTVIYQQADYPLELRVWNYIEFRAPLRGDTDGVIIKVNGDTLVSNITPSTDVASGFATVEMRATAFGSSYIKLDDVYIAEGEDFVFLGPNAQVSSMYPKFDAAQNQWATSDGGGPNGHFQYVDDAVVQDVDDDATYVTANSPGKKDIYVFKEPVGIRDTVLAVQLHTDLRADAGAPIAVEPVLNNTLTSRITAPDSGTYSRRITQYGTDPATDKAWSIEALDNIIAGLKIPGDDVPEGAALNFSLFDGTPAYFILDEEDDLPLTAFDLTDLQILDVGGTHIPLLLSDGITTVEIPFESGVTTASWQPWNQVQADAGAQEVFNAHFRSDGKYLEPPDGVTQVYGSGTGPWDVRIEFSNQIGNTGEITLSLQPESTATASHYTIVGNLTRFINPGDTYHDVPVQINTVGTWHKAKTAWFWLEGSEGIDLTGQREWHLWIYPQVDPPALDFNTASNTASGPGPAARNVFIDQNAVSQEDTKIYLRFQGTGGTWIEGTHYSYTLPDIPAGNTSAQMVMTILPQAFIDFPGEDIAIYLDHERSDGSNEAFWQFTEDWIMESQVTENDTIKNIDGQLTYPFSGEAGTHAPGGGSNTTQYKDYFGWYIKKQSSFGITAPILKPNGEEMQMLVSPSFLKNSSSDWYIRESFFLEENSGGRGRKQLFTEYIFTGSYIHPFDEGEAAPYQNSRFFTFGPRNRAPGDMEMQATFQRRDTQAQANLGSRNVFIPFWHNGSLQASSIFWNGSWWSPWARDNMDPASELGIEIETDPDTDQEYLRFWALIAVDNGNWVKTNTAGSIGGLSGTATGGTGTQLEDSTAVFNSKRINPGDVIFNTKDGSECYVVSIDSDSTITTTQLHGGKDNSFTLDDTYDIYRNYKTAVANVVEYGFAETGSVQGVKVTVTLFGGTTHLEDDEGVGKFDEVENIGGGTGIPGLYQINYDIDHETVYGEKGQGADYFYMKGVTLADIKSDGDVVIIRHQSVQPLPNANWSGNGIFRYNTASSTSYNGQQSSAQILGTAKQKGICAWAPYYMTGSSRGVFLRGNKPDPFYGPEDAALTSAGRGRYWEKRGVWWEPRGNATMLTSGQLSHTITLT